MSREVSAKCGHVKRRLNAGQPLSGEVLEFALSILPDVRGDKSDDLYVGMAEKLKLGQSLGEYEHHILVDVLLLHVKLGAK